MLSVDGRNLLARPRVNDCRPLIVAGVGFECVAAGDDDHADKEQHRRSHDLAFLPRLQLKVSEAEAEAGGEEHTGAEPSVHARLHGRPTTASIWQTTLRPRQQLRARRKCSARVRHWR